MYVGINTTIEVVTVHVEGRKYETGTIVFAGQDDADNDPMEAAEAWVRSTILLHMRQDADHAKEFLANPGNLGYADSNLAYWHKQIQDYEDGLAHKDDTDWLLEYADTYLEVNFHFGPEQVNPEPLNYEREED